MSLRSLPGLGSVSPASLTIGFDGWLVRITVLRSSFLAGPFTDKAPAETLGPLMNLFTRLSLGLVIQIQGWEGHGRKARDSRSSSRIVEPYWFWMALSRSKIRLDHKKDAYVSLPSGRSCANLLPSIRAFA